MTRSANEAQSNGNTAGRAGIGDAIATRCRRGARVLAMLSTFAALGALAGTARADRMVLGPDGAALSPLGFKAEYAITPYGKQRDYSYLQFAIPQGVEFQTQFLDIARGKRTLYALDVQYPFLSEFGPAPAVSIGVRDLLGTGSEHRSFYVAASKTLSLSEAQQKLAREFRLSIGYGTERLDGIFFGAHARLRSGLLIDAEYYRQRPNVSLGLPFARNAQARAYSLDGHIYYGLSYTLAR